jgi:hypothetical protein
LEKSRMSLMIVSRESVELWTIVRIYFLGDKMPRRLFDLGLVTSSVLNEVVEVAALDVAEFLHALLQAIDLADPLIPRQHDPYPVGLFASSCSDGDEEESQQDGRDSAHIWLL